MEKLRQLKLGIMIASTPADRPYAKWKEFPCALDNGAFRCFQKGYPFQENIFLGTMEKCFALNICLDFIVCPDIVAGGEQSLDFSMEWATKRLIGAPNLALAVQDGMTEEMIDQYVLKHFSHIFVGGSVEWKWETAQKWVQFAHKNKKECHIGQVGQQRYLRHALHINADSVDSTSLVRHKSWHHVEALSEPLLADLATEQALKG